MSNIERICVYCGSGDGRNPVYRQAAEALGVEMAREGIGLVYGGGSLGLMGTIARSVLKNGGHVTGVIPQFLTEREKMLRDVQELVVTQDMHERKRLMFEKADAFVSLPGGIGTLEETVEMLTWSQLGQHDKPVMLVNIEGFWDPLRHLFDHMLDQEFIRAGLMLRYLTVDRVEDVIPKLREVVAALPEGRVSEAETADKM